MKNIIIFLGLLFTFMLSSCSYMMNDLSAEKASSAFNPDCDLQEFIDQDYSRQNDSELLDAYDFLSSYIVLEEMQYHVSITKEDAVRLLNISGKSYDEIITALEKGNSMLKDVVDYNISIGDSVDIVDDTYDKAPKFSPDYIYVDGDPRGQLQTIGQEPVRTKFFASTEVKAVSVLSFGYGMLLATHVVTIQTLGNSKISSVFGNRKEPTIITLDASNYECSITYQTSDSFGGSCAWKALRENSNKNK